jgi:riboflavin kinase/FMN adenylyltransferase
MQVTWLPDAERRPRHVALGEFDGVHLGHREVMRGADTVLTFEPHPRTVVSPDTAPKLITALDAKADLIAGLAVRELVVIPFDGAFASRSPQDFIDHVLVGTLGAERVSVGENFRFGHRAKGDVALLRAQDAFETRAVELVSVGGEIVSSTHIRTLIEAGEIESAAALLGSPFQLRGPVAHGDKRGRALGFPTANLAVAPGLVLPPYGIYAGAAAGRRAAISIGVNPHYGGDELRVEAFLLDFAGDLYGTRLRVELWRRLRDERAFASEQELVDQIARDVEQTRAAVRPE